MATITNTTLEVGLLTVPVALRKVSESNDVRLDRASQRGNKIKRVEVDSVTGESVDETNPALSGKFENPKEGTGFRAILKDDLEAIESQTKIDSFAIEHFIPLADVPLERATACYFLAPQAGVSAKSLGLLHKTLSKSKKAGVFKLCLRTRQYLAVLYAKNGGLYINTLTFSRDFAREKDAAAVLESAGAFDARTLSMAGQLIDALSTDASVIDSFEDDLIPLKAKLVEQALAGKKVEKKAKAPKRTATSDEFEDALRASVEAAQKRKPKPIEKVPF